MTGKSRASRAATWALAGAVGVAVFVWGYQANRARWFPFPLVSWVLPDTDAKPYSWVRPASRPAASLRALSYVSSSFDPEADRVGVQHHDAERAWQGLNFYYSGFAAPFYLVDMEGNEVWRWDDDSEALLAHAELFPNGDLIVVRFDREVVRLNAAAEQLWQAPVRAHHDVGIYGDSVYVLSRREVLDPDVHATQLTLEDTITVLDADSGAVRDEFSVLDSIRRSPYSFLIPEAAHREFTADDGPLDITHTNHVEVFDGTLADIAPIFAAGNILISMRHLNAVMILDGSSREVIWAWGPSNTYGQHHPRLLPNGRILMFDNGVSRSRVIEIEPVSGRLEWLYEADDFFTALRGSVQRLANGNTLITESDTGYVFEITDEGDSVWEFANPEVSEGGERSVIWRMTRHDPASLHFLNR